MALSPITSWQIEEEKVEAVTSFLFLGSKITAECDCRLEIRKRMLLGRKAMKNILLARILEWVAISFSNQKPTQCIKKQRHHFANNGLYSQGYGLFSSNVQM